MGDIQAAHAVIRRRIRRRELARAMCRAIYFEERDWRAEIREVEPDVFTELSHYKKGKAPECPLSLAAECQPGLALAMLGAGGDPRQVPEGSGTILYSASFLRRDDLDSEAEKLWASDKLALFDRLLSLGANPMAPTAWLTMGTEDPYRNSLLAFLISSGRNSLAFIERLYRDQSFDGRVWPCPEGEPILAEDYAWMAGMEELAPELTELRRWGAARRAWISAVLRARSAAK